MPAMDFALARFNHQVWKMRLRSFLRGKEELTEAETSSHTDCDLGRWIYGEGVKQFGAYPEMQRLEKTHADMHAKVKQIVKLKNAGDLQAADQEYEKMKALSDEVVLLLTTVEQQVKVQV